MNKTVRNAVERVDVQPVSAEAELFAMVERAARDTTVDVEKMKQLLEMRERELARLAKVAFNGAMAAAQKAMPRVLKTLMNEATKSFYAPYDAISEAMQPVITENGFALMFGEADSPKPNHVRITCDVLHVAGHAKAYHADVPIDAAGLRGNANKTPTHAFSSTVSYGRRNLKLMIFDVAMKEAAPAVTVSGNSESGPISAEQANAIRALLKSTGTTVGRLCTWLKVEALPDIPASQYERVINALNNAGRELKQARK